VWWFFLLEGKRNVREEDKLCLVRLGHLLCTETRHIIFCSGNAAGADEYFSEGVSCVDARRLQVITPYTGHRSKNNYASQTIALDKIDLATEPDIVYQTMQNKSAGYLVDQYISGKKNRAAGKGAYLIRDTVKVLGTDEIGKAGCGIFYDDPEKPESGGTGHTISVCRANNVPVIDQKGWMEWIKG
jgi:hypothetical protein